QLARIFNLGDARRAEGHGAARVEDEATAQIGIGFKLLDVEAVGPPVGAPIEPPKGVAGNILAILGKLNARAAVGTGMASRHTAEHRTASEERYVRQPRQREGVEKAPGSAIGKHATSYAAACVSSTSRRTICLASIPSAWAAKVVMMRWV